MWKCPTCGAEHMQLQDVPRVVMDAIVREMAEDLKRKKVPGRAKGGFARAASLTADRRKEIARKAANARWSDER